MQVQNSNNGYVITITHFDDDPDRVAVPLMLANSALAMGQEVLVWLTLEGVKLAKEQAAENLQPKSFPHIQELLNTYRDNGGKIGVCPPCAKTYEVTDENLVANADWMGGAAVLELGQQKNAIWF